ncbi:hemolysin D [bacterium K02(2017)]|nr:hemolysin D [bacterium K02(2017)]
MAHPKALKFYSPKEELINIRSHIVGLILSTIALVLLVLKAIQFGDLLHLLSFSVFGISLITLYTASTFYHSATIPKKRIKLRIVDHCSIYILIAGSYTPFNLLVIQGDMGWVLFIITWSLALIGITLKLFFTGRFNFISTLMYILMGWMLVVAIKPLTVNFSVDGIFWIFTGGGFYTSGAIIYGIKKIKFNHAIFHFCVLLGSLSHFIAVYAYILPFK